MADGDYLYDQKALFGRYTTRVYKLLDAQTGAGAGVWVRAQGAIAGKVTVSGLGTGGVTLYSHTRENPDTDPTDSDDHEAVGSEITSNGQFGIAVEDIGTDMKSDKTTAGGSTATTVLLSLLFHQ